MVRKSGLGLAISAALTPWRKPRASRIFHYVGERTIAWLHGFRRLRIRWERRDDIHEAFLGLAT